MSGTETRVLKPSAALFVRDGFTGFPPRNPVEVWIGGARQRTIVTPSEYIALFGLASGTVLCTVRCEGFRPELVSLEIGGGKLAAREVFLAPLPSYRFPPGATLLRGTVLEQGTEKPVEGVTVSLAAAGGIATTATDEDGEFVIFINRFGAEGVKKSAGELLAKSPDSSTVLIPVLSKPGYRHEGEDKVSLSIGQEKRITVHLKKGGK